MPTSKTIKERKAAMWGVTVGVFSTAQPISAREPGHLGENHFGRLEGPVLDSIPTPSTAVNTLLPQHSDPTKLALSLFPFKRG